MPRASKNQLTQEEIKKLEDNFYQVLSTAAKERYFEAFLKELLTQEEYTMLLKRLSIYSMIGSGKSSTEIIQALNISYETFRSHRNSYSGKSENFKSAIGKNSRTENSSGKSLLSPFFKK